MQTLTRKQAIQRIRDISFGSSCKHLCPSPIVSAFIPKVPDNIIKAIYEDAAMLELMAIFDIKDEEL